MNRVKSNLSMYLVTKPVRIEGIVADGFKALHTQANGHHFIFIGRQEDRQQLCVEATRVATECLSPLSEMRGFGFSYVHAACMNRAIRAVGSVP